MPIPIDRGYVVLAQEDDGTVSLMVCSNLKRGHPISPYAVHPHRPHVVVNDKIKMIANGKMRHTIEVVEVIVDARGTLHVEVPRVSEKFRRIVATRTSLPAD